jgi:hypothetical protein
MEHNSNRIALPEDCARFLRGELQDPRLISILNLMRQGFNHRQAARLLDGGLAQSLRRLFRSPKIPKEFS